MKILIRQEKIPCVKCSGFGIFSNEHKLVHCPNCGSIHAEALGLRYEKDSLAKYMYVQSDSGIHVFFNKDSIKLPGAFTRLANIILERL